MLLTLTAGEALRSRQGTAREVGQVPLAVLGFHQRGVAAFLQGIVYFLPGREQGIVRLDFIGAVDILAAGDGFGVLVGGAPLGGHEVVHVVDVVEVGPFGVGDVRALVDDLRLADELFFGHGVFLQGDAVEVVMVDPLIPVHIHQILLAAGVVEQGGIEACPVQQHGFRPGAFNLLGGGEVVVAVLPHAIYYLDIRVDEPELAVSVGKVWRPDAAGVGIALHVQELGGVQGMGHQVPVHQVLGMMYLHAGEPLEGGSGDIVVIASPDDAGVGVEAFEDGVLDFHIYLSNRLT